MFFGHGAAPMKTAQEAADEHERQERLAAEKSEQEKRLAAERAEREKLLAIERAEQEKRWEVERIERGRRLAERATRLAEERAKARLRWMERSRMAILAPLSAARWLLRITDHVLRRQRRPRQGIQTRAAIAWTRRRVRKADRDLRGWASRLRTLNEAGVRRCLWLVSAIVLILALVVGTLSVIRGGGKPPQSIGGQEKQDRKIQSTAAAPDGSPTKHLTKAQEEQIRLRLQSLHAALDSLPASGPVDQLPNVMQQEAGLRAEISQLEAQLAGPTETEAHTPGREPGQQKTFVVYFRGSDGKRHKKSVHAASAQEAEDKFRKSHPLAQFQRIEEKK